MSLTIALIFLNTELKKNKGLTHYFGPILYFQLSIDLQTAESLIIQTITLFVNQCFVKIK